MQLLKSPKEAKSGAFLHLTDRKHFHVESIAAHTDRDRGPDSGSAGLHTGVDSRGHTTEAAAGDYCNGTDSPKAAPPVRAAAADWGAPAGGDTVARGSACSGWHRVDILSQARDRSRWKRTRRAGSAWTAAWLGGRRGRCGRCCRRMVRRSLVAAAVEGALAGTSARGCRWYTDYDHRRLPAPYTAQQSGHRHHIPAAAEGDSTQAAAAAAVAAEGSSTAVAARQAGESSSAP